MRGEGVMIEERLSWSQIVERYPEQAVGLTDVKWVPGNFGKVMSAVVAYTGKTTHDLIDLQMDSKGKVIVRDTM